MCQLREGNLHPGPVNVSDTHVLRTCFLLCRLCRVHGGICARIKFSLSQVLWGEQGIGPGVFINTAGACVVLAVSYLLQRVGDAADEAQNGSRRWWNGTVSSIRTLLVKAIPVSAITIVVVVSQIVIQVHAITYNPKQTPFGGVFR